MSDGTKGPVPAVGVKASDPAKPPMRVELRELKTKYPDQWNLFLLGMERFMDKTKEKDPLSFYQIAGIHGRPWIKWPNADWKTEKAHNTNTGYCTHTSVLFLTWHRPYLALFEQALHKHVTDIANSFGSESAERKNEYIAAAKSFRLPYWDWALQNDENITLFPKEVHELNVPTVIRPGSQGKPKPMEYNPLATYKFGSEGQADTKIDKDPSKSHATYRQTDTDALNDWKNVPHSGKNLTERVVWILTAYQNFNAMSCNAFEGDKQKWQAWGSLEDIHNAVHGYVGGDGHMGSIEVSAFDPVFWLHHNNIDRLLAIWQALHADSTSFVEASTKSRQTRMFPAGKFQDANAPLAPFNASETIDDFWKSPDTKDTKKFGYVFPETRDWVYKTPSDIKAELNRLYGLGSLSTMFNKTVAEKEITARARVHALDAQAPLPTPEFSQSAPADTIKIQQTIMQKAESVEIPTERELKDLIEADNTYLEWLVDIKAEKHANNGDFIVHVFLGDPLDQEPAKYILNHNHVASFNPLGQSAETGCGKCQVDQAERVEITGQIPLTLALAERYEAGLLNSLRPEDIEPFLAKNLHWRTVNREAQPVPRDSIEGLLVGVVTCQVTLPIDGSLFPRYADEVVPRPAATTKRQEGVTEGQPMGRGDGTGYTGGEIPSVTG